MPPFERVVLTGASGAIGGYLITSLLETFPGAELVCILRNPRSFAKLRSALPEPTLNRIRPLFADLCSATEMAAATEAVSSVSTCLTVHCAGDVSWTKPETAIEPLNVGGTRRVAELVTSTTTGTPVFVFLSTAFLEEEGPCRNAYERTKRAAEHLLEREFGGRMRIGIVRASLVVGRTDTGFIPRFNGVYPMVRLVALGEIPCVISNPTYQIDTVPIDYLAAEVLCCAARLEQSPSAIRLIAASGPTRAVRVTHLVSRVMARSNRARAKAGLAPLPEISVITNRQYTFLMKAADTWGMKQRFARVEEISDLMSGYIVHGESSRPIHPVWLTRQAPDPAEYLDAIIDYWLEVNASRILADRKSEWQGTEETA